MQDKEFQQPIVQHKKAHNWALYASFSASCMNIFLAISAVSSLAYNDDLAVVHNYAGVVWIASIVIAIVSGHRAWIGVGCQQTIVYCMNGGLGCH